MAESVAVLMGGVSSERAVSLISGRHVAEALEAAGYRTRAVDVRGDVAALTAALDPPPDAVFNALHGRFGEDGRIQGLLDMLGIPYTHSGVMASAVAMNKPVAKRLFGQAGLNCPDHEVVSRAALPAGDVIERPYVVKPLDEGSSVGVQIVVDGTDVDAIAGGAWQCYDPVMVERFVPGRELTVAVMGDRALGVLEIRPNSGFYDYRAKYTEGASTHLVPAPLPEDVNSRAMEIAMAAHEALGCRGVSRADLRYDDSEGGPDALYLLEVNTQPGMTPISLVPEIARYAEIDFGSLVTWMVEQAVCDG